MDETSTPVLSAYTESSHPAGPRTSTMAFIRQYSRAYSPMLGGFMLN